MAELTATLSSSELTEWACYLQIKHDEQEKAQKAQPPPPPTPIRRR